MIAHRKALRLYEVNSHTPAGFAPAATPPNLQLLILRLWMPRNKMIQFEIRALFTSTTIRVYQAFSDHIADFALEHGAFGGPFKMTRMSWIKPSFLWMMHRSGWGQKPGQERILGIDISRDGFEWALAHSTLSHYDPLVHSSKEDWRLTIENFPVRIQWDPERSITSQKQNNRSIQIGLSGKALELYVENWVQSIQEVTGLAHEIRTKVLRGKMQEAQILLPIERPYPLSKSLRQTIGAN